MAEPAFFCQNCKKEVSARDKICPYCGRFFTDVRCPKCGYSGEALEFRFGCPSCGYLNPSWCSQGAASSIEILNPGMFEGPAPAARPPRKKQLHLPPWFFLSITIGLGTVCAALLYVWIR
ncbi:MAG: zinc ribbon domain-containing protein [Spirochaetia bacterium]|jgi:RNA polymerase subunit RPABC4/transcription elongation factor Spt4|nr:zinc ribbon domain-containing protein [Spirochaetia bacterium]